MDVFLPSLKQHTMASICENSGDITLPIVVWCCTVQEEGSTDQKYISCLIEQEWSSMPETSQTWTFNSQLSFYASTLSVTRCKRNTVQSSPPFYNSFSKLQGCQSSNLHDDLCFDLASWLLPPCCLYFQRHQRVLTVSSLWLLWQQIFWTLQLVWELSLIPRHVSIKAWVAVEIVEI